MDCVHDFETVRETDFGEMDYSSCGGGVEHFVVSLLRCRCCGLVTKACRGDFNGDPSGFLELTDEDIAFAQRQNEKDRKRRPRRKRS